jgi:LCP family protein required for cell wall assembly
MNTQNSDSYNDPLGDTSPNHYSEPSEHFQPIYIGQQPQRKRKKVGCFVWLAILVAVFAGYFLTPTRTNILILGIDRTADGSAVGRSDTNILLSIIPLKPTVNMLSIPRDLWVTIPGVGENRINTAHFFAEASQAGTGPQAAVDTVRQNFGMTVDYYARVRFDGFLKIVDAMGGIQITLDEPTAGLQPGQYTLNGEQALAFARSRAGTDDFFRMAQGQLLLKAAFQQMLKPKSWLKLPAVIAAFMQSIDTNLPVTLWPRLGFALLRAGPGGIDNRTLTREQVTPWTTSEGANVLLPNWDAINPILMELFGE